MSILLDQPRSGWIARLRNYLRAGAVTLAVTSLGVLATSQYAELARVGGVELVGNIEASDVALRHLADVRVGDPLLFVDLEQVLDGVERHPWVASATVHRALPNRVVIEVVEHEDVLLLAYRGLYRVDAEGEIFVRARSSDLDLPILTGLDAELIDSQPAVSERILDEALLVLGAVRDSGVLTSDDLSEIHFDPSLGFTLRLRNTSAVHLGFRPPAESLQRLQLMTERGLDLSRPHEIDLDLEGLAVVSPLAQPSGAS
jgi:cell division septal protein FtsQ